MQNQSGQVAEEVDNKGVSRNWKIQMLSTVCSDDKYMYKSLHGLAGISTSPFRRSSKPTRSADGNTFCVMSSQTDPYKYSYHRTIFDWNALPASVKSRPSIHSFR